MGGIQEEKRLKTFFVASPETYRALIQIANKMEFYNVSDAIRHVFGFPPLNQNDISMLPDELPKQPKRIACLFDENEERRVRLRAVDSTGRNLSSLLKERAAEALRKIEEEERS